MCIYRWRDFWRNCSSCRLSSPPLGLSQASLGGDNIDSLPVLGGREVLWNGSHTLRTRGFKYFREPKAGGSGRHEQMNSGPREVLAPTWGVSPSLPLFNVWFCVLGLVQFYNHVTLDIWGHIVLFTYFSRNVVHVLCIVLAFSSIFGFCLLDTKISPNWYLKYKSRFHLNEFLSSAVCSCWAVRLLFSCV